MTTRPLNRSIALVLATAAMVAAGPALAADAPAATLKRTADGHPDLTGTWSSRGGVGIRPARDAKGNICVINCGGPAPGGGSPDAAGASAPAAARMPGLAFPNYKPEFKAKVAQLNREQVKFDPALRCQNPGLPRIGPPKKIVQSPGQVVFLYDDLNGAFWRIVPTDGRPHREDAEEGYFGDSVGHWEGDKLVIETNTFSDESWLTDNGAFHTANMTTVEEITPTASGGIDYKLTVNDPGVLAEPFVKQRTLNPATKELLQPVPCVERSIDKMVGIESFHPNPRW